ncbi:glycerol-3-phosphate dehydrogenase [Hyphomicrobium sp. ghe19]|uniref:glycerol-3-phosphate dehydrogenase n=1 Tax=Hyphomicrobium sp. ghe19 TaxID=2682968 RepID=UPI0013675409|nr:Aerobic glycerol-3-phosphate dehydrogenase [Hyphomicrobium sp. ghe19]
MTTRPRSGATHDGTNAMADEIYDLLVIGGGINGAGIAADAAMRGLSVFLAEADDLAGATSSASSKLIHGGLRYLEHFEFRLVREALAEREVLLAKAPHIIRPMRFILPQVAGMRHELMMRAGLFLYDHLASRESLGASHAIDLRRDPAGAPLVSELRRGFTYWDCAVDDSRLVVLNAIAAREAGARIATRTPVTGLEAENGVWTAALGNSGRRVAARAVVNAAGPWVAKVAALATGQRNAARPTVRLVKGSHITVPRIAGADDAYTFQNPDGRIVFALPFEDAFTLIGTTEETFAGDPRNASASREEEDYLLDAANRFFRERITHSDIVWSFAGVRPLEDDGSESASAVSRDYRLNLAANEEPPLLHVIGGKITTYRKLAEAALKLLHPYFPQMHPSRTRWTPLPGGDLGGRTFDVWFEHFAPENRGFEQGFLRRLARRHGTRTSKIIAGATSAKDLGEDFGGGLTAREIAYLKSEEWAETATDVLWRRTKTGLHLKGDSTRIADRVQACLDKS